MTTFTGTANADVLIGGSGNDSISGAGGNDTIVGGLGSDTLTGGAGSDVFKFAVGESGQFTNGVITPGTADLITDFDAADRLDFGLGAATAANAIVQTATAYAGAETQANAAFAANHALRYAAEVVGSDIYMFASDASGGATRSVVILSGGANAGLSLANIGDPVTVNTTPPITGTAGADHLFGTTGADVIQGLGGADTIEGGAGADTMSGGDGADLFKFAPGDAGVFTAAGAMTAGSQDVILDFTSADKLYFGLDAATQTNAVVSNASSDSAASIGANTVFAANHDLRYAAYVVGADIDVFVSDADGGEAHGMVQLKGAAGAGLGLDVITGVQPNTIVGTSGADHLVGTTGNDVIQGLDGADTIEGGLGADTLSGGSGADLFKFAAGDAGVFSASGAMTANTSDVILDFTAADKLDLGLDAATSTNAIVQNAPTVITALAFANASFSGNHALHYAAMVVGADIDLFFTDADGGEAHGMVQMAGAANAGIGLANIVGASGQLLVGTPGADTLNGGFGADTIVGNGGSDLLNGGDGNDVFHIVNLNGETTIHGGAGSDTVDFSAYGSSYALTTGIMWEYTIQPGDAFFGQPPPDVLTDSVENVRGTSYYDILIGNQDANTFWGEGGDDVLEGFGGADTLCGGDGDDTLRGDGGGVDVLYGNAGNDVFIVAGDNGAGGIAKIMDFDGGTLASSGVGSGDRISFTYNANSDPGSYTEGSASDYASALAQANTTFHANTAIMTMSTQVGGDVYVFHVGGSGGVGDIVELVGTTLDHISAANMFVFPRPGSIIGSNGPDNIVGSSGAETIVGNGGADTMTGAGGDDTFQIAHGDTGTALGQIDIITDFKGGTRGTGTTGGTGDMLKLSAGAGTVRNYVEMAGVDFADAQQTAGQLFTGNAEIHYVVAQVGSDAFVFFNSAGSVGLQDVIELQGVAINGGISSDNFV